MIGGPDQPGAGWQGASKTETVGYIYDIIRELKQLADKSAHKILSAILSAALVEAHIQSGEREH